jgi:PAS domain S-box-containing protein
LHCLLCKSVCCRSFAFMPQTKSRILPGTFRLILFLLLFLLSLPVSAAEIPNMLILNSYHPGFAWSDAEVSGFLERLQEVYPKIDLPVEYLDAKRFPDQENLARMQEFLHSKYQGKNIGIIVCFDNPALDMLLYYRRKLFPNAAIVFAGISGTGPKILNDQRNITGVAELKDIRGTLEIALTLHPQTKEVLILGDYTATGVASREEAEEVKSAFAERVNISLLPPSTYEEALAAMRSLPPDSLAVLETFTTDRSGQSLSLAESTRLLTSVAHVPVYGVHATRLGHGIVGGSLLGGREHGRQTADLALRVLAGENPDQIPVVMNSTAKPMFDYTQLERFHIPPEALPAGSFIYNKPSSIFATHKKLVFETLGIMALLIFMVAFLVFAIVRRRHAEELLRESEAKFRAAFENATVGRGIVHPEGKILQVNDSMARMLNMPLDELLQKQWQDIIHPDSLPEANRLLQAQVNKIFPATEMEMKLMRNDNTFVWVRVFAALVRDARDLPLYLVVDAQDISDRKQYEDRLRRYEYIVSASKDHLALINRNYVYEAASASFLQAHRRSAEEVIGRPVSEILGENLFQTVIRPNLEKAFSGQTVRYQQPIEFPEIGRRTMDITYFPFYDDSGEISALVLNSRDITETRRLEEKLMQSQKMESIGTLAGGVAHEINNPINGIMNYAQLLIDRTEKENPTRELAEEIIHETQRVAKIVRNLLTFARHEKQSHSPAQLSDMLASVLSLIQTVMRHDQIDLLIDIPEGLPNVKCRSQQIQQVLMNLMTNARDALNQKYPGYNPEKQLRISARLVDRNDRKFVRATVEDFGTGIADDVRDRMFDPFFTTKPKETGTGLGLSITYGIVKEHRGELTVESELGQYTRIHMDLPVDNGWELPWSEEH